mmetsp:Transcript_86913/g.153905  ORF Transcript_86913/g.153905 Transcript_86913/m.153905 type:complete len:431 (+) Transcript_86913:1-1293(+)
MRPIVHSIPEPLLALRRRSREGSVVYTLYHPNVGPSHLIDGGVCTLERLSSGRLRGCLTSDLEKVEASWNKLYVYSASRCIHLQRGQRCAAHAAGLPCEMGLRCIEETIVTGPVLAYWDTITSTPGVRKTLVRASLSSGRVHVGVMATDSAVQYMRDSFSRRIIREPGPPRRQGSKNRRLEEAELFQEDDSEDLSLDDIPLDAMHPALFGIPPGAQEQESDQEGGGPRRVRMLAEDGPPQWAPTPARARGSSSGEVMPPWKRHRGEPEVIPSSDSAEGEDIQTFEYDSEEEGVDADGARPGSAADRWIQKRRDGGSMPPPSLGFSQHEGIGFPGSAAASQPSRETMPSTESTEQMSLLKKRLLAKNEALCAGNKRLAELRARIKSRQENLAEARANQGSGGQDEGPAASGSTMDSVTAPPKYHFEVWNRK